MSLAGEHAGEAADTLRAAASIADPYLRADAIWEALTLVHSAADHLCGRAGAVCGDIARRLEEGCEGSAEPPAGDTLRVYAHTLDANLTRALPQVRAANPIEPYSSIDLDGGITMRESEALAHEAAHIAVLQVEAEEGNGQALREVDERRADLHADALRGVQAVLDGHHRTPESLEGIAEILRAIGLPVREIEGPMRADAKH